MTPDAPLLYSPDAAARGAPRRAAIEASVEEARIVSPEELVAAVAEQYDDERGELTHSALRRLARYQADAGKTCSSCGEKHPLGGFGLDTSRPDALAVKCLECAARQRRESRARRSV